MNIKVTALTETKKLYYTAPQYDYICYNAAERVVKSSDMPETCQGGIIKLRRCNIMKKKTKNIPRNKHPKASAQSVQRLCYSLIKKFNIQTCYKRKCNV